MKLDPFFDDLPEKRMKIPLRDLDVQGLEGSLEEMSDEQIRRTIEGKTVRIVELEDFEEEIIQRDDEDIRDALGEIFIDFYLNLRVLAVDQSLFPAFARFAKQETLLAGRWRDRFPDKPSSKDRRAFCHTLRHRYFIHAMAIAENGIESIEGEIAADPSFYIQKGITDYTEFLDQFSKKDECDIEVVDFLLYWHSTSPLKEFASELQHALDLASSLSPKNTSVCEVNHESLVKVGLKLSKSDWDFISAFYTTFLQELCPDSGLDQLLSRSEDLAFKVAHSGCRADLQDKALAFAVSAGGGDISHFTHFLICRDAALGHRTYEEFHNDLPAQWLDLVEYWNAERDR